MGEIRFASSFLPGFWLFFHLKLIFPGCNFLILVIILLKERVFVDICASKTAVPDVFFLLCEVAL
jgi:hypothetical protein